MRRQLFRITTVPISLKVLLKGQHKFMSSNGFEVVGVSSAGVELQEVEREEEIRVVSLEMTREITPFADLKALWQLYKLLQLEKPTIVHSITPKAGLLSMLAGKMAGVPIRIHTFTGLIFPSKNGILQRILILMDKLLCWSATHVYPEGQGVLNDLKNFNITKKELKVLANGNINGIDTSFFSLEQIPAQDYTALKAKLGISSHDFVFIFVGRLVSDKGINELVSAFKVLVSTFKAEKQIKLLLVGSLETDLDPLNPDTLSEINNNPNIISVGFKKDVRPYFAISDALVFPSYREGFPNVVLQAGAMELPSIVTDINGCNEIIVEGVNGTIIPVKSSEAITNAMNKVIKDKDYYEKLKANTRSMITSRYEQKVVWEAILKEYRVLLSERGIDYNV